MYKCYTNYSVMCGTRVLHVQCDCMLIYMYTVAYAYLYFVVSDPEEDFRQIGTHARFIYVVFLMCKLQNLPDFIYVVLSVKCTL